MIWNMAAIRIASVQDPFATQPLTGAALETLALADAMGLLEAHAIDALDARTVREVARAASRAGIASEAAADLRSLDVEGPGSDVTQRLELALRRLRDGLEESPVPDLEWRGLLGVLGPEMLARLTGTSESSVRRYSAATRATPDDVAARLHFIAKVVGDLRGSYNDFGIRRWFERKRSQLGGRSPAALMKGSWSPDQAGPRRVRLLARSLATSFAT